MQSSGLISTTLLALAANTLLTRMIDGSRDRNFTRAKMKRRLEQIEESVEWF